MKLLLLALLSHSNLAFAEPLTNKGAALKQYLVNEQVEEKWLPGKYVDWKTGATINPTKEEIQKQHLISSSHCSAFVAAVALQFAVPFLNQDNAGPDQVYYLSNHQNEWLNSSAGVAAGWKATTLAQAEGLADQGELVIASFKEVAPKKAGHIAIVVPDDSLTNDRLAQVGPTIIQAGGRSPKVPAGNSAHTDTVSGFYFHTHGKLDGIQFFYHDVNLVSK